MDMEKAKGGTVTETLQRTNWGSRSPGQVRERSSLSNAKRRSLWDVVSGGFFTLCPRAVLTILVRTDSLLAVAGREKAYSMPVEWCLKTYFWL